MVNTTSFSVVLQSLWCVWVSSLTCGIILQHWVLAERLVSPGEYNILAGCRCTVVTAERNRSKQSRAALLLGNNHLNADTHCGDTTWIYNHTNIVQKFSSGTVGSLQCLLEVNWYIGDGRRKNVCDVLSSQRSLFTGWKNRINRWTGNGGAWNQEHSKAGMKPAELSETFYWDLYRKLYAKLKRI